MKIDSPCKACKHRRIECHSTCVFFAAYRAKLDDAAQIEKRIRKGMNDANGYVVETIAKYRR